MRSNASFELNAAFATGSRSSDPNFLKQECFWSTRLLSETDHVRVWEIRLAPGERIGFHRHVLDYFWTAVTPGRARSHPEDGTIVEAVYSAGETRVCTENALHPNIVVMKPTNCCVRFNASYSLNRRRDRRIPIQRPMRS
jgi:quercetin dioxygenase-like cupin family protein